MLVLVPPDPPPGLSAEAGAALALGVLLDAVDALARPAVDLRVLVADPAAAPLVAALLPPGVAAVPAPPPDDAQVVRLGAPAPAELAAALDRAGAPSRSPRAWHLSHRLPELAHSGSECQGGLDGVRYDSASRSVLSHGRGCSCRSMNTAAPTAVISSRSTSA